MKSIGQFASGEALQNPKLGLRRNFNPCGGTTGTFYSSRNTVYVFANSAPVAQPDRATDF